jgi:large subunit ribosomal protein L11
MKNKMNVKLLVDGGAMKPGPALSQKLGPAGIPINEVISQVNEATTSFKGMQVPVELEVDLGTKTFEIQVFSPPISGLLKKEAGVEKGSGLQSQVQAANLSIEQIISVAKQKMGNLLCKNLKSAVKITIGSCVSLGFLVENLPAVKVNQLVEEGKYDKEIEGEMIKTPEEKRKELDTYFAEIKVEQEKILKEQAAAEEEKKK